VNDFLFSSKLVYNLPRNSFYLRSGSIGAMMNIKYDKFNLLNKLYEPNDNFFLNHQSSYYDQFKPLKDLKILQNIPLTLETLKKVETLLRSGADLTVTCCSFLDPVEKAVQVLQDAGVKVVIDHNSLNDDFDIVLDCSAELRSIIKPRKGSVELTKTGVNLFRASTPFAPVIDIDSTRTKEIETVLGTGDGFIRAFLELTNLKTLEDKPIVVFGFGKVGQGIVRKIIEYKGVPTIIEADPQRALLATMQGHKAIDASEKFKVETVVSSSYAVVTATGINEVISQNYDEKAFIGRILANMGGGDEFGIKIPEIACLANKSPINFAIDRPTLMKYIDPIFYLHNYCAELLAQYDFKNKVYTLNTQKDFEVSSKWEDFHKETI